MERLTIPDVRIDKNTIQRSIIDEEKVKQCAMEIYWRLKAIEDAVADAESEYYNLDRIRELVEADRDGRCVVLPSGGYADKDGENALKSAMNTCFYHNNPVTRYIADAVAEKLTHEAAEAALKGDQHGQDL